ncbi:hypothetical protein RESH_01182 [Rhodopirellula europaea SH398]|uniref:Uncharacterized protein n=1 Tax=Rhodopirellula europaea SH398 TaxID=1263868 RepID=M5S9Q8_9BACT|nr:hypothetical protein RESH_01182 [Rhodopirellula europaea SH398]
MPGEVIQRILNEVTATDWASAGGERLAWLDARNIGTGIESEHANG